MELEAQDSDTPSYSTDSATTSTRSGHLPGTPKPPISPPRRRSSLAFSRVFPCTSAEEVKSSEQTSPTKATDLPRRTPSNTSRKRMPASVQRTTVTPGHVAQTQQKLLQSAKAALRVDMAFAASPTGSIGSRLPPDKAGSPQSDLNISPVARVGTPGKGWRFSIAPRMIAGLDNDVREPVDEGSPTLPRNLYVDRTLDDCGVAGVEPISSGFTSPVSDTMPMDENFESLQPLPSSPPLRQTMDVDGLLPTATEITASDLQEPMTGLKVSSEDDSLSSDVEESPIVMHLKKDPAEPQISAVAKENDKEDIVLSEPARAAAESAKAKRGLLRTLFPKKENRKSTAPTPAATMRESPRSSDGSGTPCPDPALHTLVETGKCPNPSAHLGHPSPHLIPPGLSVTPEAAMGLSQYVPGSLHRTWYPPPPPFHRATATGSPMPFARTRSRPSPLEADMKHIRQSSYSNPSAPYGAPPTGHRYRPGTKDGRPVPSTATEHFQPGWYYSQESSEPAEQHDAMVYSFSTAAAKVGGQSSAPDSRIRDSYRTDTLTPLARPPNRYRKTGLNAVASNRGASRFYGDNEQGVRPPSRKRPGTGRTRRARDSVQFRSSPPRQSQRMQSQHKRRRPREFEDENIAIREDAELRPPRLAKDESVMEIDDETRAAVRMSIFGSEAPEPLQGHAGGLKELSPNVTPWRKGMRQSTKKQRRPSYWDGDLQQIRESPAGRNAQRGSGTSQGETLASAPEAMVQHGGPERRVCTSPAQEDIENVEEQTGVIGFDGESVEAGMGSAVEGTGSFVTGEEEAKAEAGEEMEIDVLN